LSKMLFVLCDGFTDGADTPASFRKLTSSRRKYAVKLEVRIASALTKVRGLCWENLRNHVKRKCEL
jgi:hypothetical protein